MIRSYLFPTLLLLASPIRFASGAEEGPKSDLVILDETGVKNLRLETAEAEESTFEETVFSLGRIEAIPRNVAAVSSRISGRVVALPVTEGDSVEAGAEVAKIESRQPGDPPPVISLKAPLGGLVTHVDVRLGDPVDPENALLEIADLGEVHAVARVPEHLAGTMPDGAKAHIKVAALPKEEFEGELLRFGTSADMRNGTIDAVFRLTNPGGRLREGMRAEFSIVMESRENVLSIPRSALQGEAANRFVYVRDFDLPNAFLKTPVEVGEINDRRVEIVSGLFPADEVVTRGAYSLSFAGASGISLKEALDAAHGHEHAADGSELTPEKLAEAEKAGAGHEDHDHEHSGVSVFWRHASIALFLLLLASLLTKRHRSIPDPEVPAETPSIESR